MKVLLIHPPKAPRTIGGEDFFIFEPLALEYLAAGIAGEHDVRILDLRLDQDLPGVLADLEPDVVGLTAYTADVNTVRHLAGQIKRALPEAVTVVGGHHATVAPADFYRPDIDVIVRGEGVLPFRELLRRIAAGRDYRDLAGVLSPRHSEPPSPLPPPPVADLNGLPLPARGLTAPYRSSYFSEWMKPLASIRTSKGCPFRCNFCALWKIARGKYLKRELDGIVTELGTIDEPNVFFADDESLVDARRMALLAARIKEAGIRKRYFLYGRSDTIAKHPELLRTWREVGLERVFIGLEFFRDADLQYVNKGSSARDNERALAICRDLDIDIYGSFMIRPDFDRDDFRAYRDFIQRLELSFVSFSILTPLPGTDLYEATKDTLLTREPDFVDFIHTILPTKLPLPDFYEEIYKLYRAIPLKSSLRLLRKFPAREIPGLMWRSAKMLRRVRTAYRDYA